MRKRIFGLMVKTYLAIFGVVGATLYVLNNFFPQIKGAVMV